MFQLTPHSLPLWLRLPPDYTATATLANLALAPSANWAMAPLANLVMAPLADLTMVPLDYSGLFLRSI